MSSLYQVLEILESSLVEPNLRRSALSQVDVILSDPLTHEAFLERGGLQLVLRALHDALLERTDETNLPRDSIVPCITVLKNICLHNSVVRQELAANVDLYYCLLRSLIIYSSDKFVRQEGAILLALLLFSECVLNSTLASDTRGLSLSNIIVEKMSLPFKCNTHCKTSPYSLPKFSDSFMSDNWCRSTLRMHWNIEYYGGMGEIINWSMDLHGISEEAAKHNASLRLTAQDLKALRATSILYCCQEYLYNIQNATTHEDVLDSLRGLSGYMVVWLLLNGNLTNDKLISLPWQQSFLR